MINLNEASSVEIGGAAVANRVVIEVKNDTAATASTRVTVEVGCGYGPKNLLSNKDESVKATYRLDQSSPKKMASLPGSSASKRWRTLGEVVPARGVLSITLEGFRCETQPGDAEITVIEEVMSDEDWKENSKAVCQLTKKFKVQENPELCYFRADPEFVLHAGSQKVTVSFLATGYDTAFLFRNNEAVGSWSKQNRSIAGAFPDEPSITSIYRLSLRRTKPGTKDEERKEFYRTVQVMSPGWNRISLPQGSPTRLFRVESDFETGTSTKLYGIFQRNRYRDPEGKSGLKSDASLYSSANGVDNWDESPGAIPARMVTSPGVYFGNRLWLIGGGAAGPDKATNEIWCYQKQHESSNAMEWKKSGLQFPPETSKLPPRFGHSCVVFGNEIWVLGGHDEKGNSHQDIWRIQSPDNFKTFAWATGKPETAPWPKRCLHSSAVVRAEGGETLWIYGGAAYPQGGTPYVDLWYMRKGQGWRQQLAQGANTAIEPDPGKPLGSALVAYSDGAERAGERLMLLGSFLEWKPGYSPSAGPLEQAKVGNRISSFHFEWQEKKGVWESKPVGDGWQQFEGENFAMQTLALNGFIYVYTFDASAIYPIEGTELVDLKLNIRIP